MYWVLHSQRQRHFPNAEISRLQREISRWEEMYNTSRLDAVYVHCLIINPPPPCWTISIDSVKINSSLVIMRGWKSISPALEISPGLRPRKISRASGWDMYWDISIHDILLLFLSFDSHKTCHVYHKTFQIFLGWCEQPHICAFITGYT